MRISFNGGRCQIVGTYGLHIASVAGFPSGKHLSAIKAAEAVQAVDAGADEIDMVIDVGAAVSGEFDSVRADIAAVRIAVPDAVLKVIVESAALLSLAGEDALTSACRAAADAGADFVKTSTGFHPSGGASLHAVKLMAAAVGAALGVKAAAAFALPTMPSRCWTRAPPVLGCQEPAPCWTVWSKGHAGRAGS